MPAPMPDYDWTTDPVVLERLKKSPCFADENDLLVCDGKAVRAYLTAPGGAQSPRPCTLDDAHHIEAAWMVELAKKARKKEMTPIADFNPDGTISLWLTRDDGQSDWCVEDEWPIRAYALALDWLEGEKT